MCSVDRQTGRQAGWKMRCFRLRSIRSSLSTCGRPHKAYLSYTWRLNGPFTVGQAEANCTFNSYMLLGYQTMIRCGGTKCLSILWKLIKEFLLNLGYRMPLLQNIAQHDNFPGWEISISQPGKLRDAVKSFMAAASSIFYRLGHRKVRGWSSSLVLISVITLDWTYLHGGANETLRIY